MTAIPMLTVSTLRVHLYVDVLPVIMGMESYANVSENFCVGVYNDVAVSVGVCGRVYVRVNVRL